MYDSSILEKRPVGVIFSLNSTSITKQERIFFQQIVPLGYILFSRNFKSYNQIKNLIKDLKTISRNKNALIFIDQEGGRVQRLKDEFFKKIPPQSFFEFFYNQNPKLAIKYAEYCSSFIGYQLKEVGVDVNFSPVLDLRVKYANKIIGDRAFSSDPKIVSELGYAYCKGLRKSGIIAVPKHFPGHGRSKFDSHKKLPKIKISKAELFNTDLMPFIRCKKELFFMIAHIVYSKIDNVVATYSKEIVKELLIKELNFKGLIISDDLSMCALEGTMASRTKKTYESGCDIVLYCAGKLTEMKEIYENGKVLSKKKFDHLIQCKKK